MFCGCFPSDFDVSISETPRGRYTLLAGTSRMEIAHFCSYPKPHLSKGALPRNSVFGAKYSDGVPTATDVNKAEEKLVEFEVRMINLICIFRNRTANSYH